MSSICLKKKQTSSKSSAAVGSPGACTPVSRDLQSHSGVADIFPGIFLVPTAAFAARPMGTRLEEATA